MKLLRVIVASKSVLGASCRKNRTTIEVFRVTGGYYNTATYLAKKMFQLLILIKTFKSSESQ